MDAPLRVLVADHSPARRAGVRLVLENEGCSVCAEAGDASAAIEAALLERPDVCLLDTELLGGGLTATAEISSRLPGSQVVAFSDSRSSADLVAALEAGASGYLPKDIDPARLAVTLRRLLEGEAALPRALVTPLIEELRRRDRRTRLASLHHLTSRALVVLELLSQNLSTAEIADRLVVAKVTVRSHVASILKSSTFPVAGTQFASSRRPDRLEARRAPLVDRHAVPGGSLVRESRTWARAPGVSKHPAGRSARTR